jgi:hypothetical protein
MFKRCLNVVVGVVLGSVAPLCWLLSTTSAVPQSPPKPLYQTFYALQCNNILLLDVLEICHAISMGSFSTRDLDGTHQARKLYEDQVESV